METSVPDFPDTLSDSQDLKSVWTPEGVKCHIFEAFDPPWKVKIWVFPKIGVPQNGWFIMESPIKMDDLGVPLFSETPI